MNKYPKLRQFLRNQIGSFENMEVVWKPGHTPTAFLQDEKGETVHQIEVGDKDVTEIFDLLKPYNFVPTYKPQVLIHSDTFGGHLYELYQPSFFEQAVAFASTRFNATYSSSGYLLTISDDKEGDWIVQLLKNRTHTAAWLGAQDKTEEGQWRWIGGPEPNLTYSNWAEGEPNNHGEENCAIILTSNGKWNDISCAQTYAFIVEFGDTHAPIVETQQQDASGDVKTNDDVKSEL